MQQISGPIFEDKVIDFILEMAKVTEVTIRTAELYKAPEDEMPKKKSTQKKGTKKKSGKKTGAVKKKSIKKPVAKNISAKK